MTNFSPDEAHEYLRLALREFLRADGWPVATDDEDEDATAIAVEAQNGRFIIVAQVLDDAPLVLFTSVLPVFVPEMRRGALGEFLHRANYGLLSGGFQFDPDEGEVRFVTSLDLAGAELDALGALGALPALFRQIVYRNVSTVDQYLPALMTVVYSEVEPRSALERAEHEEDDD